MKKLSKKEIKTMAATVYSKLEKEQCKEIENDKELLNKKYKLVIQQLAMNELSVIRPEVYELIISLAKESLQLYANKEDDSEKKKELTDNYEKFLVPIIEAVNEMF